MVVLVPQLISHVLNNPKSYPGPHNQAQERTSKGLQKLDSHRQLTLIWDAASNRLRELLLQGNSVNVPNFGTFSYYTVTHKSRFGPDSYHKVPCFVPCNDLKKVLGTRYDGKEDIALDPNGITAAQSIPQQTMFLNEVPIASGCYYRKEVVVSALRQVFTGVQDLCERGYDLELSIGCATFHNKQKAAGGMRITFDGEFTQALAEPKRGTAANGNGQTISDGWKKPEFSAAMSEFIERPNSADVDATRIATNNISVMGKDLTGVRNTRH